jgi:hypothetical protein
MLRQVHPKPHEQRRERTVEVVAVATSPAQHAADARERVDPRRSTKDDVDVLVRDGFEVGPLQSCEQRRIDLTRRRLDTQPLQIRVRGLVVQGRLAQR